MALCHAAIFSKSSSESRAQTAPSCSARSVAVPWSCKPSIMPHANVVTMVIDGNSLGVQGRCRSNLLLQWICQMLQLRLSCQAVLVARTQDAEEPARCLSGITSFAVAVKPLRLTVMMQLLSAIRQVSHRASAGKTVYNVRGDWISFDRKACVDL